MVVFRSPQPEVHVPQDITIWEWLFESKRFTVLENNPERPLKAFIDAATKQRLSYDQAKAKAAAFSTRLVRQYGLSPGDTVSVISPNSIWYPVCAFAVYRAGARFNGIPPAFTVDEISYALTTAKTKFIIAAPSTLTRVVEAATSVGIPKDRVLLLDGKAEGFQSMHDLIAQASSADLEPPYRIAKDASNKTLGGNLSFSSGTTGLPKAVLATHHNAIAQCIFHCQLFPSPKSRLGMLPMYHIMAGFMTILMPVFTNIDMPIMASFSMKGMLQSVVDFKVEELSLVPPIVLKLARDPLVDQYDLRHVKLFVSGAAPLSSEILKELEARFPWTGFRSGYGATEAGVVTTNPETHLQYKYATAVGQLVPNTIARVVDPSGNDLEAGVLGELLFKGPTISLGYLDNAKANMEAFDADGWYHSGDAGYFDQEGFLFIKDRLKEMIKVKGSQVAPAELEDLLLGHEAVADCAVIGIPDEYAGELPKAYIVLKNTNASRDEAAQRVFAYVREKKARFKWLAEIEVVDAIPKSPAGKLLRQKLRAADRIARSSPSAGSSVVSSSCFRAVDPAGK